MKGDQFPHLLSYTFPLGTGFICFAYHFVASALPSISLLGSSRKIDQILVFKICVNLILSFLVISLFIGLPFSSGKRVPIPLYRSPPLPPTRGRCDFCYSASFQPRYLHGFLLQTRYFYFIYIYFSGYHSLFLNAGSIVRYVCSQSRR